VPSVVSRPLARAAARFRCPICSGPLVSTCGTLRCGRGHSFDVSRHGHVALMPPTRRPVEGDNAAMVAKYLAWWDTPFEVLDSPELLAEVKLLAQRYADASRRSS